MSLSPFSVLRRTTPPDFDTPAAAVGGLLL